jgi:DeoR family transcriptional regulator, ulaG and ulaABCDEF operon transcriptional repressor
MKSRPLHERERWQTILRLVRERGVVPVSELAQETGASSASIRRDLGKLAETGAVRRVHGGVEIGDTSRASVSQDLGTRAFEVSRALNLEQKRAIAAEAAKLCLDGQSIIINAGSTTYQLVEPLAGLRLNVLTNSFPIAEALIARSSNRVMVPGGEVYRKQAIILSPFDDDTIQHYAADIMFMSCASLGSAGVIEGDPLIARAEVKLLKRAQRLVVLVDASKFEPRGSIAVCPLSRISTVVTDRSAPASAIEGLRKAGVEVIVVEAGGSSEAVA